MVGLNTDPDGFVHCSRCGKPILHRYDLIVHHKRELSEANVNDAMVALNPDNVECVCFHCHNQIHERFVNGHASTHVKKQVFIVYGSPAAGKSTFVRSIATSNDLVVDLDQIWQMVSINDEYVKPAALKSVVFQIRDELYDIIKYRSGWWHTAYIITGGALKGDRERLQQRVCADDLIYIDTGKDECMERIRKRMHGDMLEEWQKYVDEWWNKFQPD